ncbi:MAG: DUF1707 domain-containing protein [Microbacteriaceae bacterium]
MIDFSDPATHNQRLSNAERDEAVAALDAFATEGRLTGAEAAQRSAAVRAALARGELAPLFADLPAAGARPTPARLSAPVASTRSEAPEEQGRAVHNWQYALAGLAPFVAIALFFITGTLWGYNVAWLWFLLIPVVGILVYGAGGWSEHERARNRERRRERNW